MDAQISPRQAEEALTLAKEAAKQMRRALETGTSWAYLVIWGVIWTLGFLGNQFLTPKHAGTAWMVLDGFGILLSFGLGVYYGQRVRYQIGAQMAIFWGAWLVYSTVVVWVSHPINAMQTGLLITVLAMFAYVVIGIWARSPFLGWLGVGITACTLAGYYFTPLYFNFVMALTGLALAAGGLYMRLGWK